MPGGWQLGAHARAAAALEAAGGTLATRAHHVERSATVGDERAIALLTSAARSATVRAPLTAGRWFATALRLLADSAGPQRRLALLTETATALAQGGAFDESLALLEQALPLVSVERAQERAALITQIAVAKRQTGHPLESRSLLEEALGSLPDADGADGLLLRIELAIGHYFGGEFAEMGELAGAVLGTVREREDLMLTSLAAALASIAETSRGRTGHAAKALREAAVAFDALSDEQLVVGVDLCGWIGLAATRLERIDEALRYTRRGLEISRATRHGSTLSGLLGLEAQLLLQRGQVSEAVRVAETATDAALVSGNDQLLVWTLQTSATVAILAGELDRAVFSAREAVALARQFGEAFFTPLASIVLAGALQAVGDAAGARRELDGLDSEPAASLLDLSAARGWELLARTHLELGDVDAAEHAAIRAEERAAAGQLPLQTATALCARSAVLLARGDTAAAREAAADAAGRAERAGNPLLAARGRALTGRALAALGEHECGIAELELARETFASCGARRDADAAARELRRLGQRVRRPARVRPGTGVGGLSTREREVADQVAAGKTNRGIAEALFLSEKTIESHLARIYGKLGVHSRVALAALVERERTRDPYNLGD